MVRRRWAVDEKASIVMEVLTSSVTLAEICRKYNAQPSLVCKWKENFIHGGTRALTGNNASHRERQLEQENQKLKEMLAEIMLANELLKKGLRGR